MAEGINGKPRKLLSKPLRVFIVYAFAVLVCSIPAYYAIVDFIWLHELNEHNRILSEKTKQNIQKLGFDDQQMKDAIALWNQIQPETAIQPSDMLRADSVYTIYRHNTYIPSKGSDRFQGLVSYFKVNGSVYRLVVENNVEESHETIAAITGVTILFFFVLLTGLIYLNKRIAKGLWMPFYTTLDKISEYDLNRQEVISFEKNDIEEFTRLNDNIEKLVAGNLRAYKEQKEFTENVSHELQTPLAVVRSKLDLLLQSHALTDEQFTAIEQANNALSRVSYINKNMLLLARIENNQYADTERIAISTVVNESIRSFSEHFDNRHIQLKTEIREGVFQHANKILVEILVNNLLFNSIRHNIENGQTKIILSELILQVATSGDAPLKAENLFKRFSVASGQTAGSGLGLAIVQQVCTRYGWDISYRFENGSHLFSVLFPGKGS